MPSCGTSGRVLRASPVAPAKPHPVRHAKPPCPSRERSATQDLGLLDGDECLRIPFVDNLQDVIEVRAVNHRVDNLHRAVTSESRDFGCAVPPLAEGVRDLDTTVW